MDTQNTQHSTEEDIVAILMMAIGVGAFGGILALIGGFFDSVTTWALENGILLQGSAVDVPLPWQPEVGLDWGRTLIIAGVLIFGLLSVIFAGVRRHRKRTMVD